jgi:hypothetical protein
MQRGYRSTARLAAAARAQQCGATAHATACIISHVAVKRAARAPSEATAQLPNRLLLQALSASATAHAATLIVSHMDTQHTATT